MASRNIEIMLSFSGNQWVASANAQEFKAASLPELERMLEFHYRNESGKQSGNKTVLHLRCNLDMLPDWIRQYHPHYFNRKLVLPGP